MKQQLGFQQQVNVSITEGATTPNPGGSGALVWSTSDNTLKRWNGTAWNTIGGSGVPSITGTANQVLVNGTSGSAVTTAATLTLPQSIATTSSVTFAGLTATSGINSTAIGATTPSTGAFTTLSASSTVTLSPASAAVTISPTGTGTVAISPVGALTINPTAASTINNTSIGVTTKAAGSFTTLASNGATTMTAGTASTSTATGTLVVTGGVGVSGQLTCAAFATTKPAGTVSTTYTIAATDIGFVSSGTGVTVTLPAASSYPGRWLYFLSASAVALTSASSNVIPATSTTAGTAITAATAGKWCAMVSNGTNWQIMMYN